MKSLYERLDRRTVRMECVIVLAGMLNDGDAMSEPLRDLMEDDPEVLAKCFPDMPQHLADLDDSDEFKEAFASWAYTANKWGFVVQFARPVMTWSDDGMGASYSWGYYNTAWMYGDTLNQAVSRGLKWAAEREKAEKAKAKSAARAA